VAAATGGSQARTAAVAAATTGALTSDFPLQKGYAVKLSTLPVQGTDRAAATKAEAAAKARGANQVGLINPKEFTTKPDQGSGSYVIYSGSFKDRAGATRLLAKLKRKFPGAVVIAVASANGGGSSGKALSRTSLGTAHQVAGFRPSAQKVKQDTQLVQRINRQTGRTYVQSQRNLPDQIVVGGTPGSAPAPPQGSGQP
jgi:hypothetical protein